MFSVSLYKCTLCCLCVCFVCPLTLHCIELSLPFAHKQRLNPSLWWSVWEKTLIWKWPQLLFSGGYNYFVLIVSLLVACSAMNSSQNASTVRRTEPCVIPILSLSMCGWPITATQRDKMKKKNSKLLTSQTWETHFHPSISHPITALKVSSKLSHRAKRLTVNKNGQTLPPKSKTFMEKQQPHSTYPFIHSLCSRVQVQNDPTTPKPPGLRYFRYAVHHHPSVSLRKWLNTSILIHCWVSGWKC